MRMKSNFSAPMQDPLSTQRSTLLLETIEEISQSCYNLTQVEVNTPWYQVSRVEHEIRQNCQLNYNGKQKYRHEW